MEGMVEGALLGVRLEAMDGIRVGFEDVTTEEGEALELAVGRSRVVGRADSDFEVVGVEVGLEVGFAVREPSVGWALEAIGEGV